MAKSYLLGCTALCSSLAVLEPSASAVGDPIAGLLDRAAAPPGVVFEILEEDEHDLQWALTLVDECTRRLRARYPDLDLSVVTHGVAEFALQSRHRYRYAALHHRVERLVELDVVPVHVCETGTKWNGTAADDFPAYVDVVPAGSAQIRRYEQLGYERVRLEKRSG